MFCSVDCMARAQTKYHRHECGLVQDIWKVGGIKAVLAYRRVASEFASFKDLPSAKDYLELTHIHLDPTIELMHFGWHHDATLHGSGRKRRDD
uniref:Uncharacterized protein n=1 Tax=Anopheles epiroticus TaxID=199890 RepID=A0A182P359_9DIPT